MKSYLSFSDSWLDRSSCLWKWIPAAILCLALLPGCVSSAPPAPGVGSLPPVGPTPSPTLVLPATVRQNTPTPVPTLDEAAIVPVVLIEDTPTPQVLPPPSPTPNYLFDSFVQRVKNGQADKIVGVYVEGVLALPVVQQPMTADGMPVDPGYVSTREDEATQFLYAYIYANGNIGLLAHNYLAGRYFFNMHDGDVVSLIYGDGRIEEYRIAELNEFQALSPRSTTSNFIDLNTGETLTATELFYRVYGGDKRVTFQTCINRDNDTEWGRFFPVAFPSD